METMKVKKINVTADDISHGISSDCLSCPIALAIRRIVKKDCRVEVRSLSVLIQTTVNSKDNGYVHVNDGREIPVMRISLPQRARDFVDRFDSIGSQAEEYFSVVKPFSFKLPIPVESLR